MSMSRQIHLDALRGIAALIVIIHHYFAAFYPYTIFGIQAGYQQHSSLEHLIFLPPFGLVVSGQLAVSLLFILSGYVLSYKFLGESKQSEKILAALVKRPIRLGGLVWLSIIIGYVFWHYGLYCNSSVADLTASTPWFKYFWYGDADFSSFLGRLMTASFSEGMVYNPPLRTIAIELYGSIMVYVFLLLFSSNKYRIFIVMGLIVLFKDSRYQGFWVGMIIADFVKNYNMFSSVAQKKIYHFILITLFIYFSSYPNCVNPQFLVNTPYFFLPNDEGFGDGYPILSALLIFIVVLSNDRLKAYLNRPGLLFFGKISYGMYIIHFLILGSLSSWTFLLLNDSVGYHASFLIVFVTGLPLIVIMAYLATRYMDNPSIKLAQYVGDKTISSLNYIRQNILFPYREKV